MASGIRRPPASEGGSPGNTKIDTSCAVTGPSRNVVRSADGASGPSPAPPSVRVLSGADVTIALQIMSDTESGIRLQSGALIDVIGNTHPRPDLAANRSWPDRVSTPPMAAESFPNDLYRASNGVEVSIRGV